MKMRIFEDTHAGCDPHSGSVDVRLAVVVKIEPACAHAGPDLIDLGLFGNGRKRSVAIVAVEIVSSKVIDDV